MVVRFGGREIARTSSAYRVLETSHPPTWYLPPKCFAGGVLRPTARRTFCEWKGQTAYFDVVVGDRVAGNAAWTFPDPVPSFGAIRGYVSLYPAAMDEVTVGGEVVRPQAGGFYGGWVTDDVVGPFKGEPGTMFW